MLEKDIQTMVEKNLESFFGLEFVDTEFELKPWRIDTLAFDQKAKSFVIIEYKKAKKRGLFEQGMGYRGRLYRSKHEVLSRYNSKMGKRVEIGDIDWEGLRIIFISPSFTERQKDALLYPNPGIELWQINMYEGIVELNSLKDRIEEIEELPNKANKSMTNKELEIIFQAYCDKISMYDHVKINMAARSFKTKGFLNFAKFYIKNNSMILKILIDSKTTIPKELIKKEKPLKTPGLSSVLISITNDSNFDKILKLIRRAYEISLNNKVAYHAFYGEDGNDSK